jgi:hypothetical protein
MEQQSLTDGFEKFRKTIRKEQFLQEMDRIMPWSELSAAVEPYYPKPEGGCLRFCVNGPTAGYCYFSRRHNDYTQT